MAKRREIYDSLCRLLTDYEERAADASDLYDMLCEIQRRWEDTITVQDEQTHNSQGWSRKETVYKNPLDILNVFRNRYYADGGSTENGIVADAINDILPRMILPPCKVGDTVYYINLYNHIMLYKHEVYEAKVVRLVVTRYGVSPVIRVKSVYSTYEIPGVEFGKNVFHTREEAEQAIKEKE